MTEKKKARLASVEINPVALREKLGLNQTDFWARVCVTQSGGSRYESGRKIPRAVQKLLVIAYGTPKQAEAVFNQIRMEKAK